jgi:hypothetical protein
MRAVLKNALKIPEPECEPQPQQPQTSQDFAINTIFKMHDNITKIIMRKKSF